MEILSGADAQGYAVGLPCKFERTKSNQKIRHALSSSVLRKQPSKNTPCYEVLTTLPQFRAFKTSYKGIHRSSQNCSIFNSWEWLYTWKEATSSRSSALFIIAVYSDTSLIGVAPFQKSFYLQYGIFPLRKISFIGTSPKENSHNFDLGLILKPGFEHEAVELICECLAKNQCHWDQLDLKNGSTGALWSEYFQQSMSKRGFTSQMHKKPCGQTYSLPPDMDNLYRLVLPETRAKIQKLRSEFSSNSELTISATLRPTLVLQDIHLLSKLSSSPLSGNSQLLKQKFVRFHRQALLRMRDGQVMYTSIKKGETIIAAALCYLNVGEAVLNFAGQIDTHHNTEDLLHYALYATVENCIKCQITLFTLLSQDAKFFMELHPYAQKQSLHLKTFRKR